MRILAEIPSLKKRIKALFILQSTKYRSLLIDSKVRLMKMLAVARYIGSRPRRLSTSMTKKISLTSNCYIPRTMQDLHRKAIRVLPTAETMRSNRLNLYLRGVAERIGRYEGVSI